MQLKFYTIFSFVLFFSVQTLFAQVPKNIIVEHFTNTRCGICASKNPALFTNLNNHPGVLHVSFHPSSPYGNCSLSQHNYDGNDGRTNYYGIYGSTPKIMVQGTLIPVSTSFGDPDIFTPYLNQTSPISIEIVQTKVTDEKIEATINIKTEVDHNLGDLQLFVGVAEQTVNYAAPNGESIHHNVFRKEMTAPTGDAVTLAATGDIATYSFSVDHNADWDFSEMFTFAILQDASTKEVIQAQAASPDDNTTSTKELNTFQDLKIYPNPTSDRVFVNLEEGENSNLRVFNVFGKLLLEKTFSFQTEVDFSAFPEGAYFLEIKNMEGHAVQKIIKN